MNIERISREFVRAQQSFAIIELYPTVQGGVYLKAALQTTVERVYVVSVTFTNYPNQLPSVYVTKPALPTTYVPHRYSDGTICYLLPNLWNPGTHDIQFILARTAKWLHKYEVWRAKGVWPGASMKH
jgi:hypothetical protein